MIFVTRICSTLFALMLLIANASAGSPFDVFAGEYIVVSVRNNSFAAAPAEPGLVEAASPIGKSIEFNTRGVVIEGIGCDSWQAKIISPPMDLSTDTMLADLRLPPSDSAKSKGDRRILKSYRITCEGELFADIYQADSRVLAMSWGNSRKYLILERPLSTTQIKKLQKALKLLKFYSGPKNGQFDTLTKSAVRQWYSYRLANPEISIPERPAITENLLDTLKVID